MGDFLDFMAQLDLIDKADALFWDIVHKGQVKVFHVDRTGGWTGWQIEQMLKRHGVAIWGRGFTAKTLCFHVKAKQASWAEYLMQRAGIAVVSEPVDARNVTWAAKWPTGEVPMWGEGQRASGGKPETKTKGKSLWDHLSDLLQGG